MQIVGMEVDDIELSPQSSQLLKHQDVVRQVVLAIRVGSKRGGRSGYQPRAGAGIAAGKERYAVPEANQFFGQPRNDALSSTVSRRRNTFIERSNLGNIHEIVVAIDLT